MAGTHDRLEHLYRYDVTQTEILGKDYTIELRGRGCRWVPGKGIFLPADVDVNDDSLPFGVIQRVFATGASMAGLPKNYSQGRTVTLIQKGFMPGLVAGEAFSVGRLLFPFNNGKFVVQLRITTLMSLLIWMPPLHCLRLSLQSIICTAVWQIYATVLPIFICCLNDNRWLLQLPLRPVKTTHSQAGFFN